jgi:micrococcal nuclease
MKGVILALLLALSGAEAGMPPGLVTNVIDGDTLEVDGMRVRLIGVSVPELKSVVPCAKYWAHEAFRYVAGRVLGRQVRIETDVERTDRFGRRLAYVWIDGEMLQELLIRQGLGRAVDSGQNRKYRTRLVELDRQAAQEQTGMHRP